MSVLPDNITHWCGQCNKHLVVEPTPETLRALLASGLTGVGALAEHLEHKPLRRVGIDGDGLFWWTYGEFGTHKTRFAITFPKPMDFHDVDLGARSIMTEVRAAGDQVQMTHYDPEDPSSYEKLAVAIGNFDPRRFTSLIIDSGDSLERAAMTRAMQLSDHAFMELPDWIPSGERFGKVARQLKWYTLAYGVQVLVTSNEDIDKEYGKGAFVKEGKGLVAQDPIAIKGLPSLAGKWAKKACRLPDVIARSRYLNNEPVLVVRREAIGFGGAYWETKDRTGKLEHANLQWNGKQYANGFLPPHWPTLWEAINK